MDRQTLENGADQVERSWMSFFVRNQHMTTLFLLAVVVSGLFSFLSLPVESDPEVKIPIATVTTPYPGAAPADTEKLVTDIIEENLKSLDDLNRLTSVSSEGVSTITVEFDASADLDESIRHLRDEVESIKGELPDGAEDPFVTQIRAADQPILIFALIGDVTLPELDQHASGIQDRLEGIGGVSRVEVQGVPELQMQVLVNIGALEGLGLSVPDVAQAISQSHVDFPIGSILTDELTYRVSFKGQVDNVDELKNIVIASREGRSIFLRDIADVREAYAYPSSRATVFQSSTQDVVQSVSISLYKQTGEDLLDIIAQAKDIVDEYQESELPDGIEAIVTLDFAEFIKQDINQLLGSAWQTVFLIGVVLFLTLGAREAFVAALSIPILYLMSAVGLAYVGATFNFLTFFALILSLGIVVDTSAIIIEGVYEAMRDHNFNSRRAAFAAISVYRSPLISGTLTTIAAFVPLGLMTGIMGEYVKHIPNTINVTLVSSLFTALFILPALAAVMLKRKNTEYKSEPPMARVIQRIRGWYGRHIERIVHSARLQRRWIWLMLGLFGGLIILGFMGVVRFQMFGVVDTPFFNVSVEMPEGTSIDRTMAVTADVEEIAYELPGIERVVTTVRAGSAQLNIWLQDEDEGRETPSYELAAELRKRLAGITEADVRVEEQEAGPPSGAAVELRLLGDDIRVLEQLAAEIRGELEQIPGAQDVRDDLESSPGEYHFTPKRDRLQYFGVTSSQVASQVRTAVFGDDRTVIRRAGEETPIVVRLDYREADCLNLPLNQLRSAQEQRSVCRIEPRDITMLTSLLITTPQGQVPLSELVDVQLTSAVTSIRHFEGDRVVNVLADVSDDVLPAEVTAELLKRVETMEIPAGARVEFGGESEDLQESMQSLASAALIGILLIISILVYQFGSFKQVLIILFTMPLAVMGVMYGLTVLQLPMSFPGLIGLTALLGVVVNDAIVLIDRFNTLRRDGDDLQKAVQRGSVQRLQPVIITTLTTALGVAPLIFAGEIFRDLALVLAIGITVATVFTLVMVPIFYIIIEDTERGLTAALKRRIRTWRNKSVVSDES